MSLGKSGSVPLSKAQNVSRTLWRALYSAGDFLSNRRPVATVHTWRFAFRSFLAHIRIQRATGGWVDLDRTVALRDGSYSASERTIACAEGIEKLKATHPLAGVPHFQAFQSGFDEGERYGISLPQDPNNPDQSHSQTPSESPSEIRATLSEAEGSRF